MEETNKRPTTHKDFANIRPYTNAELPTILKKLLAARSVFEALARFAFPRLNRLFPSLMSNFCYYFMKYRLRRVKTIRDFQVEIVGWFFFRMLHKTSSGIVLEWQSPPDPAPKGHLLLSNHRDISVDPALICYSLYARQQPICMIGIGDNLLQNEYATDVMRLNRSFIVQRTATSPKLIYQGMKTISAFIHAGINENENIWLAQREGRAKDSRDRTEPAVIKMLMLAAERNADPAHTLNALNIRPVSISYQYDPCDLYKARELSQDKQESNQIDSSTHMAEMTKGITGYKGKIHVVVGKIMRWPAQTSLADIVRTLDEQIIRNYRLFNSHFYALHRLVEMGEISRAKLEEALRIFKVKTIECRYLKKRIQKEVRREWLNHYLRIYANRFWKS